MSYNFAAVVVEWFTTFSLSNIRDILLEFLALIAFVFLIIVVIIANLKAPILIKHGSIEMIVFVVLGFIHAFLNFFDEFVYFTQEFYNIWKITKDVTLLIGAIALVIGFFRFFAFSARLFGAELEPKNVKETDTTEF